MITRLLPPATEDIIRHPVILKYLWELQVLPRRGQLAFQLHDVHPSVFSRVSRDAVAAAPLRPQSCGGGGWRRRVDPGRPQFAVVAEVVVLLLLTVLGGCAVRA